MLLVIFGLVLAQEGLGQRLTDKEIEKECRRVVMAGYSDAEKKDQSWRRKADNTTQALVQNRELLEKMKPASKHRKAHRHELQMAKIMQQLFAAEMEAKERGRQRYFEPNGDGHQMKVGGVYEIHTFEVVQVIDEKRFHSTIGRQRVAVDLGKPHKGFDGGKATSGGWVVCVGSESYTAVTGAKSTIPLLADCTEVIDRLVKGEIPKEHRRIAPTEPDWKRHLSRQWKSWDGKFSRTGWLRESFDGDVVLVFENDQKEPEEKTIPISKLSASDKQYVKAFLDARSRVKGLDVEFPKFQFPQNR